MYARLKDRDNTILLVKDEHGYIFGSFNQSEWHYRKGFYGGGESFVFTFQDDQDITVYGWSQEDERFQYSDDDSIAVGGGVKNDITSGAAIFLTNYFKTGRSSQSTTYHNAQLSKTSDFTCNSLEIWGFDFI